jgi:hypothetical protein
MLKRSFNDGGYLEIDLSLNLQMLLDGRNDHIISFVTYPKSDGLRSYRYGRGIYTASNEEAH